MKRIAWLLRRHAPTLALWGGIGLAAAALLVNTLAIKPLEEQQQALERAQEQRRNSQQARLQGQRSSGPQQQLAAFYAHFEQGGSLTTMLARLHAVAKASGLEMARGEYRMSSSAERKLDRYQVTLPISGSYKTIRVFVSRALRELPTLSLDLVQFQRRSIADGVVEAQVTFTFHLPK